MARAAAKTVGLDLVLWVPTAIAPHRIGGPHAGAGVRRRMVEAVVREDPRFGLCALELERGGVSYTVDTLRALAEGNPSWSLFLVLGADQVEALPSWRGPRAVMELARLVAVARNGRLPREVPGYPEFPVLAVPMAPVAVSSSGVRKHAARGMSLSTMVASPVAALIQSEGLYRERDGVGRGRGVAGHKRDAAGHNRGARGQGPREPDPRRGALAETRGTPTENAARAAGS